MSLYRPPKPGADADAYCTRCKRDLTHTILSLGGDGSPDRVRCNTCGSEHRYLPERSAAPGPAPQRAAPGTPQATPAGPAPPDSAGAETDEGLVAALRALLAEAGALPAARLGSRWEGGTLVLRPGKPGAQEKEVPIDAFFRKVVMVRDRLRVLEQQINANEKLSDTEKLALQQYITRCYGSLTTFNALFESRDDWFVGEKKVE
jgi:hypothetical protein